MGTFGLTGLFLVILIVCCSCVSSWLSALAIYMNRRKSCTSLLMQRNASVCNICRQQGEHHLPCPTLMPNTLTFREVQPRRGRELGNNLTSSADLVVNEEPAPEHQPSVPFADQKGADIRTVRLPSPNPVQELHPMNGSPTGSNMETTGSPTSKAPNSYPTDNAIDTYSQSMWDTSFRQPALTPISSSPQKQTAPYVTLPRVHRGATDTSATSSNFVYYRGPSIKDTNDKISEALKLIYF